MSRGRGAQRFYERWARLYDLLARSTPGIGALRRRTADALSLEPDDVVVEMGCGTGANLGYLHDRVGTAGAVVGLDFTRGVLDQARTHAGRQGSSRVHVIRADATNPPICNADAVVATFVVGMFSEPGAAVDEWCDRLGPGGRIALLNMSRSDRWYGPVVNVPFRALVIASTPSKRRLPRNATELLDRRVGEAHETLQRRCVDVVDEEFAFGLVRLSAGTVTEGN